MLVAMGSAQVSRVECPTSPSRQSAVMVVKAIRIRVRIARYARQGHRGVAVQRTSLRGVCKLVVLHYCYYPFVPISPMFSYTCMYVCHKTSCLLLTCLSESGSDIGYCLNNLTLRCLLSNVVYSSELHYWCCQIQIMECLLKIVWKDEATILPSFRISTMISLGQIFHVNNSWMHFHCLCLRLGFQ